MLSDAIRDIDRARMASEARRRGYSGPHRARAQLDAWIVHLESMLEKDEKVVPEPFVRVVSRFVLPIDARLYRSVRRNRERDAVKLLDILFEAQQALLPTLARSA